MARHIAALAGHTQAGNHTSGSVRLQLRMIFTLPGYAGPRDQQRHQDDHAI
jgi:hypothetical protein